MTVLGQAGTIMRLTLSLKCEPGSHSWAQESINALPAGAAEPESQSIANLIHLMMDPMRLFVR